MIMSSINIMAPTAMPLMEGHIHGSENTVAFQACSWRRDWGTKYQQLLFSYWYSFFSNKYSVNCCKPLVIFRVLKSLILTLATCSVLSWRSGCALWGWPGWGPQCKRSPRPAWLPGTAASHCCWCHKIHHVMMVFSNRPHLSKQSLLRIIFA